YEALGEAVNAALASGVRRTGPVGRAVERSLDPGVAQGGDVFEGEQFLAGVEQGAAQFGPRLADRVVEERLQRAVPAQQLRCGLWADAFGAGQPVGRVAARGEEVGHLFGADAGLRCGFPPVAPAPLRRALLFGAFPAAVADVEAGDALAGALVHVAIA